MHVFVFGGFFLRTSAGLGAAGVFLELPLKNERDNADVHTKMTIYI